MKKQIIYSKLIPRVFSSAVDLLLLYVPSAPVLYFFSLNFMVFYYKEYFISNNVELYDYVQMLSSTIKPEFLEYLKKGNFSKYVLYNLSMLVTNLLVIGSYFVGFWYYKGATISKLLLHMRIVDSTTFEKPRLSQLIKRFLGYLTFPIGIWFILFSSKRQALHDKISGTVVIKN